AEATLAEERRKAEAALAAERALLEEERAKSEQALAQAEATLAEERRKAEAALAAERALLEEERTKAVAEFERLTAEFAAERQDFQARIAEEQRYLAVERAEAIRNIEHERSEAQRLVAHEQAVLAAERAEALRNIEHERARADALMASTSWRITAPLRKATEGTRRVKRVTKRIAWHAGKVGLGLLPLPASTKTSLKTVIARRITAPPHAPVQSSLLIEPSIGAVSPAAFEIPAALDLAAATPAPSPAAPSEPTTQPAASRPPPENAAARFRHADQRQRRRPANVPAPPEGVPEVSIVIPVYNQLDYTLQCLDSVVRYTHGITYETIVVDDCSTDRTQAILSADPRIVYHRNAENLGFIGSCHAGANRAQGRYLVFLNNDTEVLTNWLIELVETLEYAPDAGIAGAQLVFPNGILQEAGGIVWQDGSAWNYGRMKDPMAPEVSYLREADYVSGAALAISKELWQQSGGFDFHYRPAYGEDSDLCFRVRSLGLKVYYQPLAKVIHYEGISSGTDTSQGVKAYQVTNAKKLYERWKDDMARHRPNAEAPEREKERDTKKRMLVIDACTPEPDKDAGSITAWEIMRSAQSLGYKVTFIPESNFTYLGRYSDDLARVGIEAIHYPFETTVQGHLEKRGGEYDAVLVFRGPLMAKYAEVIRRLAPRARLIFHTSDLHYLRAEREAELDGTRSLRAESLAKQKMQELAVIDAVDCTIVHSTHESEVLAREKVKSEVVVFPWIMDVHGRGPGFAERHGIMFLGGYQHPPNVDAVEYFASAILPLVARELPGVPFYAVGSKPPEKLRQLPGVTVSGFVEDLRDYVDRCRIAVVPLRYGAGIKGKLATSMSYGLPSVTTSMGAEGMELVDGREVVIADTPEAFAAAVVKLYRDEAIWNAISDAGLAYVDRMYSRAAGRRIIATVLGDTESGAA
ncbi:MAG: glycosyltransferase, partial [Hyphomicrobiaceae bacterium]